MVIVTPKKGTSVGHSESFECLYVKIGQWVWPGRVPEKKKKKKVTQGAYFGKIQQAMGMPPVIRSGPNLADWLGPVTLSRTPILSSIDYALVAWRCMKVFYLFVFLHYIGCRP